MSVTLAVTRMVPLAIWLRLNALNDQPPPAWTAVVSVKVRLPSVRVRVTVLPTDTDDVVPEKGTESSSVASTLESA